MIKGNNVLFLLVVVTMFFSCSKEIDHISNPAPNNADMAPTNSNINRQVLLNLVNSYRSSGCNCGSEYYPPVAEVRWNNTLEHAAKAHTDDMNNNNYFSHTGRDGSTPGDRISRFNYNWSAYGENIAKGYLTEQSVIEGWINSPGHCANIMSGNFREMGIARTGNYWAQEFGTQR